MNYENESVYVHRYKQDNVKDNVKDETHQRLPQLFSLPPAFAQSGGHLAVALHHRVERMSVPFAQRKQQSSLFHATHTDLFLQFT